MNLLNRMERSFSWLAIGHLPIYIVTAQAILYLWTLTNPGAEQFLGLDPWAFRSGEYWRVLTFLFMMPHSLQHPIWAFFYLYFQYVCGNALEEEWGSFPLTIFYLLGAVGSIAAAFLVGGDMHGSFYFNDAVFLAFAALFPNFQILLFFIIPIKVKWIAWITWARIGYGFVQSPVIFRIAILVSLMHYFVFFGWAHLQYVRDLITRWRHRQRYKDFSN